MADIYVIYARLLGDERYRPIGVIEGKDCAESVVEALGWKWQSGQFRAENGEGYPSAKWQVVKEEIRAVLSHKRGWDRKPVAEYVADLMRTLVSEETSSEQQPNPQPEKASPAASVNARMIDELGKNPAARDWSKREWAAHLKCSESAVQKTSAWDAIMQGRAGEKLRQEDKATGSTD